MNVRASLDALRRWLERFEAAPASLARQALDLRPATLRFTARAAAWHARGGRYLFVLGHMRSGSSLLAHILQSNTDIAGVGETHRLYRHPLDLVALATEVTRARRLAWPPTWILEKALDARQVSPAVLADLRVRYIVLTREPRATLSSMLEDIPRDFGPPTTREARAARTLARSYDELAEHALTLGVDAFALDYQDLIDAPELVLSGLTRWLGLRAPLTPEYRVDAWTSARGRGDPTPAIRTGRIDAAIPRVERALDPSWLALAARHYRRLRAAIARAGAITPR